MYSPPGGYRISEPIEIRGPRIKGLNASITQMTAGKDILRSSGSCHMLYISGPTFVGGRDQIHLDIPGGGGVFWRIIDCHSSYRLKPHYSHPPIKVIDRETGKAVTVSTPWGNGYDALDLRKAFGPGVHTLDVRLYWGPWWRVPSDKVASGFELPKDSQVRREHNAYYGDPPLGTYMVLDYVRAQMAE